LQVPSVTAVLKTIFSVSGGRMLSQCNDGKNATVPVVDQRTSSVMVELLTIPDVITW